MTQTNQQPQTPAAVPTSDTPVPSKFQNPDGSLNSDALLKSYLTLEKKLGDSAKSPSSVGSRPDKPTDYDIRLSSDLMHVDESINKRLFDLGFTNAQAQFVYDLAAEKVIPLLQNVIQTFQTDRALSDLEQYFGGADRFNTVARQISAWGEKHLNRSVFEALSASKDGILTLYKMMTDGREPGVLPPADSSEPADTEESLKRLMQDPKYWKKQDPDLVRRIENGFKRLYPAQ